MGRYAYTAIVGITAGASTPSGIIEEVVHKMNEEKDAIIESQEPEAAAEETKAAEAVETEVKEEEPVKEVNLDEMSFAEAVDYTFKTLYNGERVTG
jgi:4-hydroxy-3-methylbut-2-enyl diphosphate reductase